MTIAADRTEEMQKMSESVGVYWYNKKKIDGRV